MRKFPGLENGRSHSFFREQTFKNQQFIRIPNPGDALSQVILQVEKQ